MGMFEGKKGLVLGAANDRSIAWAIAREIMEENGIRVSDLWALARPRLEAIQHPSDVHFTEDGSRLLAEQVSTEIRRALGER